MVIVAAIIRTSSVPALFVCDAQELIEQCVEELAKVGITNVNVIRGDDDRINPNASVNVASIQTLRRRDKPEAGLVLIDEAHLSASESYATHVFEHYEQSIIIGFTATPTRLDGRPLGNLYECMEIVATYQELIKGGFIAEPLCYGGSAELDLSTIKMIGGDYDEHALGDVMRDVSLVGQLVDHWQKLANKYTRPGGFLGLTEGPYRRTFVFAVNIQHSLDICERFSSAGVRIAHLDGTTPDTERRRILKAISVGELDAITNVGVLLKGVDIPSIKCVVHARPTQSIVLWRQSCGRPLRPWHPGCHPGCREHPSIQPIILDHANNIPRHGFPHEDLFWELTAKARPAEKKTPTRICQGCFAYLPAHKRTCPYCGAEAPPPEVSELPKESEEQLRQLVSSPEEMRRMYFNMIVQVARAKGYKPGFAGARYKSRYGAWPPWEWSEMVKASFASDPEWQANFSVNQKRKEKALIAKQAKELAKIEEPDDD
jgi:DNA repair protein RadD